MNTWPDGKLTKTVREVAGLLGVHYNTMIRWIKSGQITCTRYGRNSIHFTYDQVVDFIEASEFSQKINHIR